jgi:hypothetical protein
MKIAPLSFLSNGKSRAAQQPEQRVPRASRDRVGEEAAEACAARIVLLSADWVGASDGFPQFGRRC